MNYEFKRNGLTIATVYAQGTQDKKIMGQNLINVNFELNQHIDFRVGDDVEAYGETYWLHADPQEKQESAIRWAYSMSLKAVPYDLIRAKYFMYAEDNVLKEPNFDLTGKAEVFIDLIIQNISRTQSGWTKGDIDDTETMTLSFSNENCMSALSRLAETFKTEYWVEGKTIHLTKKGQTLDVILEQGKGKGLRKIERVPIDDNPPITRLYVFGGEKNIPADYRGFSKSLKLPVSVAPDNYISINEDKYPIREEVYNNEEIFPKRTGTVTAVGGINEFNDAGLDFNINDQLIEGTSAKVKFLTGLLSGYQFEIAQGGYNHATRRIKFLQNKDEKSFSVPSETLKPAIGDKWVLIDVIMPEVYISNAEHDLYVDGMAYLNENSGARFNYQLTLDPFHFQRNGLFLSLGSSIRVKSTEFNLDQDIRIVGYTRDLQKPFEYPTVEVSSFLQFNAAVLADSKQREIERAIKMNQLSDINKARNNRKSAQETLNMMFNPDTGKLYPETLEAGTITAQMLSVGSKSQDFKLTTLFSPNSGLNVNRLDWSAGILTHYLIETNGGTWNIPSGTISGLDPSKAYYIYGKCDRSTTNGSIVVSPAQIKVEDVPGYYHFWIGILNSVINGYRLMSDTAGVTEINGRQIRTGVMSNTAGEKVLDLDLREFHGAFKFTNGDDVESVLNATRSTANEAKGFINTILPGQLSDLQNQIDGQIMSWFYDYEPTLLNLPSGDWATATEKDKHLGDLFYWKSKGYAYRFQKDGASYVWQLISDSDITLALSNAQRAQDTADGKRRVFVVNPFTPYEEGDLWAQGSAGELMRCNTTRLLGSYNAADWGKASKYTDDTLANQAYNAAEQAVLDAYQAKITAEAAKLVTDYFSTEIIGALLSTGTVLVGSGTVNNAGITGVTDEGGESVRFWAGDSYANKDNAPFKVQENGKLLATDAVIKGFIEASSGKIGNWEIDANGLFNDSGTAYLIARELLAGGKTVEARIGANILPGTTGLRALGYFINEEPNIFSTNYGIIIGVSGATKNVALNITAGDVVLNPTSRLVVQETINNDLAGITYQNDFRVGGERWIRMKWVKGVLVSAFEV